MPRGGLWRCAARPTLRRCPQQSPVSEGRTQKPRPSCVRGLSSMASTMHSPNRTQAFLPQSLPLALPTAVPTEAYCSGSAPQRSRVPGSGGRGPVRSAAGASAVPRHGLIRCGAQAKKGSRRGPGARPRVVWVGWRQSLMCCPSPTTLFHTRQHPCSLHHNSNRSYADWHRCRQRLRLPWFAALSCSPRHAH